MIMDPSSVLQAGLSVGDELVGLFGSHHGTVSVSDSIQLGGWLEHRRLHPVAAVVDLAYTHTQRNALMAEEQVHIFQIWKNHTGHLQVRCVMV